MADVHRICLCKGLSVPTITLLISRILRAEEIQMPLMTTDCATRQDTVTSNLFICSVREIVNAVEPIREALCSTTS
jgi:hypothetical protein